MLCNCQDKVKEEYSSHHIVLGLDQERELRLHHWKCSPLLTDAGRILCVTHLCLNVEIQLTYGTCIHSHLACILCFSHSLASSHV